MKKLLAYAAFCFSLSCLALVSSQAQPPDVPVTKPWTVKAGNPTLIEPPADWSGNIQSAAFSPDGSLLATAGGAWDQKRGVVFLWNAHSGAFIADLRGHQENVMGVSFSPDGKLLATQSQDGALFVWDVASRDVRHRLQEGRKREADALGFIRGTQLIIGAWSPDSKTLAAYEIAYDPTTKPPTQTCTIKLFDAAGGELKRTFQALPEYFGKIAWTKDGRNLLLDAQRIIEGRPVQCGIRLIDGQTGEVLRSLLTYAEGYQFVQSFSPDGRYALVVRMQLGQKGDAPKTETTLLWDLDADRAVWTQTVPYGTFSRTAFSADGKLLVVGNSDGDIIFRNAQTGETVQTLPTNSCSNISGLAISPDARRIVHLEESSSSIHLWDLDAPLPTPSYASRTAFSEIYNLRSLEWKGDGLRAISSTEEHEEPTNMADGGLLMGLAKSSKIVIQNWNAATGSGQPRTIVEPLLTSRMQASPDGDLLAVELGTQPEPAFYKDESIGIYDLRQGKLLRVVPELFGIGDIAWSPNGQTLATTAGSPVKLWNPATGELRRTLETKAGALAWSPDGALLATGSPEGQVQFFDAETGAKKQAWEAGGAVRLLAFSPGGQTLAVGLTTQVNTEFAQSSVRLFNAATGEKKQAFPVQRALVAIRWTPDGKAIAASSFPDWNRALNGELRIWDAATGAERVAIDDHCGLDQFAFSPDGARVATHGWNKVRVWDLK